MRVEEEGKGPRRRTELSRAELEAMAQEPAVPLLTVYDANDSRLNRAGVGVFGGVCIDQGLVTTQPDAVMAVMWEDERKLALKPQLKVTPEAFAVGWRAGQPRLNLGAVFAAYGIKVPPDRLLDVPVAAGEDEHWGRVLVLDLGRILDRPRETGRSGSPATAAAGAAAG